MWDGPPRVCGVGCSGLSVSVESGMWSHGRKTRSISYFVVLVGTAMAGVKPERVQYPDICGLWALVGDAAHPHTTPRRGSIARVQPTCDTPGILGLLPLLHTARARSPPSGTRVLVRWCAAPRGAPSHDLTIPRIADRVSAWRNPQRGPARPDRPVVPIARSTRPRRCEASEVWEAARLSRAALP